MKKFLPFLFLVVSCGSNSSTNAPPQYVGNWGTDSLISLVIASDGYSWVRADGNQSGSYNASQAPTITFFPTGKDSFTCTYSFPDSAHMNLTCPNGQTYAESRH